MTTAPPLPGPAVTDGIALAQPENLRGMAWMAVSALAMVASNMLVKDATVTLPPVQVVWLRAIVIVLILAPWVLRRPAALKLRTTWRLHLIRALLGTAAFVLMTFALKYLLFADAVALAHTIPLWMILIAAALLGERVGWRRTTATVLGFVGVLLIVRPSLDMNPFALAALGGALFSAFEMFYVKRLTATVTVAGIVFTYSVMGVLLTAVPAALVWQTPTTTELALAVGIGVAAVIGHLTTVNAYRLGEASVITPVGYMRMPFSVLIGLMVFSELPTLLSLAGIVVILGATLYISVRESRLRREGRL